jgi:hypothetical protein
MMPAALQKEKTAAARPGSATVFQNTQHPDSSATNMSPASLAKTESTLFAAFALRGFSVHRAEDGYIVCRWGLTKVCPDLRTLTAFATHVGAQC